MKQLSIPDFHQKRIAISTLRMSDIGARIMGGPTKDESRAFLKKLGYSSEYIQNIEK